MKDNFDDLMRKAEFGSRSPKGINTLQNAHSLCSARRLLAAKDPKLLNRLMRHPILPDFVNCILDAYEQRDAHFFKTIAQMIDSTPPNESLPMSANGPESRLLPPLFH